MIDQRLPLKRFFASYSRIDYSHLFFLNAQLDATQMQENYQKQHSDESDKKEKGRRLDLLVDGKESYVFEVFFFFFFFFSF